jgi:hypothetical protein
MQKGLPHNALVTQLGGFVILKLPDMTPNLGGNAWDSLSAAKPTALLLIRTSEIRRLRSAQEQVSIRRRVVIGPKRTPTYLYLGCGLIRKERSDEDIYFARHRIDDSEWSWRLRPGRARRQQVHAVGVLSPGASSSLARLWSNG